MSSTRQLAAIMFTDIVGYTALMGKDEQEAFALLEKNRRIQKPIIEQYNGKWIKELGDGVMASFTTVSDAVHAAVKIQQACNSSKDFQLRIGIHLGEVVFENNDVFGDGVNIASRIQALATPGGIWISDSVHNSISNKTEFRTKFFAEQKLKNVKEPVKVYQVIADGVTVAQQQIRQKIRPKRIVSLLFLVISAILIAAYFLKGFLTSSNDNSPEKHTIAKSIAVLPFVNMSGDKEQEYFSDGITEDIITQISKIIDLKVISRTAVMPYKNTKKTIRQISKELNVATILEGSIRREVNQVRIVAQLINAETNEHLWAETYDEELTKIFVVQSKVAEQIAAALKTRFSHSRKEQAEGNIASNAEAYDLYLRGKFYFNANTRESIDTAIHIFKQAVKADPKFSLAYASLALAYAEKYFNYAPETKWKEQAFVALEKALTLDRELPDAYHAKARLVWIPENHFPHELAVAEFKQAISLRPNFIEAKRFLSAVYSHIGLHEKAFEQVEQALALSPQDPETLVQLSHTYYYQQKFNEMLAVTERAPRNFGGGFNIARTTEVLLRLNRVNEAEAQIRDLFPEFADHSFVHSVAALYFAYKGENEHAEQRIRMAIMHGKKMGHFHHSAYNIGAAYSLMNKTANANQWLRLAAEDGLPCYTFYATDPFLDNMRNDNEFKNLLSKLKTQWEHFKSTL